jgi:hypothetical protein
VSAILVGVLLMMCGIVFGAFVTRLALRGDASADAEMTIRRRRVEADRDYWFSVAAAQRDLIRSLRARLAEGSVRPSTIDELTR